jgi:hypothetical protein
MRRDDALLTLDSEFLEHRDRVFHRVPIGTASHNDCDFGLIPLATRFAVRAGLAFSSP